MISKQVLKETEDLMKKALQSCHREFAEIRSGRAHPSMVEGLIVDYYGTPTPLKQIASVTVPDARLIIIQPWDPSSVEAIQKAILNSNLGFNPLVEGKVLKVPVPPLSEERREELIKVVKHMAEEGKISVRTVRRDAIEKVRQLEKDKKIGEDDKYRLQEEIQKFTDKYIEEIDKLFEEKRKELLES